VPSAVEFSISHHVGGIITSLEIDIASTIVVSVRKKNGTIKKDIYFIRVENY
jgi:hypothetical protein